MELPWASSWAWMPWRYAAVNADLLRNSGEAYLQGIGLHYLNLNLNGHPPHSEPCSNVCGPMPEYWHTMP